MGKLLIASIAVGAVLALPASSIAGPALSVKSQGQWYWSVDIANTVYPPITSTPGRRGSTETLMRNLPLDRAQKIEAESKLAVGGPFIGMNWKPSWTDGTVVFQMTCVGSGASIASDRVNIDLFHKFRCAVIGATYKRLPQFEAAAKTAALGLMYATAPVPQPTIDAFVNAEVQLGTYQLHGDPVHRTITLIVDGRRDVGLLGVTPVS